MQAIEEKYARAGAPLQGIERLISTRYEELHAVSTSGERAFALWEQLRAVADRTFHYPVILGGDASVERVLREIRADERTAAETLISTGLQFDARHWFLDRREDDPELFDCEIGEWVGSEDVVEFQVHLDAALGTPLQRITIALVPTCFSWEAPAVLRFGGWNDCPRPEEHVCVLRYWRQFYGAELVGVTPNSMELRVESPPVTREGAMDLAEQQVAYCPDLIRQRGGTLSRLAGSILDSRVWAFRWE